MPTRALAPLVLLLAFTGCSPLFEKPTVSVRRVDITSVSFTGVGANVVFAVQNPNILGIDLARLAYQLNVDGHQFVQGAGNNTLHVPAQGTGELQLPVAIKFVELAEVLTSLFTKRQVPFTIATKLGFGTPLGVLDVPISYNGQLPVPQVPSLSMGTASVAGVSLTGASLGVVLNVHNSNSFPLPVGGLHYAISVAGVSLIDATTPPQQLAANATVPLTISAHLDFLRAGMGVVRAIQSRAATLALDGTFDLVGYAMPVHLQTTLH